ncbi:MAG TPA: Cthe_2314 family HEPN domain-containing protein, partial [Candidatus Omnitrophota bacterium]|nr:Cthe_2314 family HEPN domain-containing protein [Candidatus Omnitrophota bacterium]
RWSVSPGRDGCSVEYFPDFENIHYEIKKWFDYYSDVFYYKLFSALDIVGHILNNTQNLKIKKSKVSFSRSLRKLEGINDELFETINSINQNQDFKTAQEIRNDITHNYLPSSVGVSVTIDEKQGIVGERAYITSCDIINNINSMLKLFKQILDAI